MSNETIGLPASLRQYLLEQAIDESAVLAELRETMSNHEWGRMQIAPEQGRYMAWLVEFMGAKRGLEIGVFTGYSSICFATSLPAGGRLVGLDNSKEWTDIAKSYWQKAGVSDKIELRLVDALDGLDQLINDDQQFDFAFLDADKERYDRYLPLLEKLVRPGGLLMVDNVFWNGAVAEPANDDATASIQRMTKKIFTSKDWRAAIVPIADGLLVATKLGKRE